MTHERCGRNEVDLCIVHLSRINSHFLLQVADIICDIEHIFISVLDIKPRVLQGLSRIYTGSWVFVQHLGDQVLCIWGDLIPIFCRKLDFTFFILKEDFVDIIAWEGRTTS